MSLAAIRAFCRRLVAPAGPVAHPVYCEWCQVYRPGRPAIIVAWSSKPGTSGICPECRLRATVDNRALQEIGGSEGTKARPAPAEACAAEADLSWSPLPARQAKCAGSSESFPPAGPDAGGDYCSRRLPGPAPSDSLKSARGPGSADEGAPRCGPESGSGCMKALAGEPGPAGLLACCEDLPR